MTVGSYAGNTDLVDYALQPAVAQRRSRGVAGAENAQNPATGQLIECLLVFRVKR